MEKNKEFCLRKLRCPFIKCSREILNRVGIKSKLEFRRNIAHRDTNVGIISILRVFKVTGWGESIQSK